MTRVSTELNKIPDQFLYRILRLVDSIGNHTEDFSKPHLNPYFKDVYPVIIGAYSFLILFATLTNVGMAFNIFKHNLHQNPTCAFLINIAFANIFHVAFVLPITLAVMLMSNYIFGQFMCYCLPMFQVGLFQMIKRFLCTSSDFFIKTFIILWK